MGVRHKSVEGMTFEYRNDGFGYHAIFSYGNSSRKVSMPRSDYLRINPEALADWRKAKYAEAERHFGIIRMKARIHAPA